MLNEYPPGLATKHKLALVIYVDGPITYGASSCIVAMIPMIHFKCIYLSFILIFLVFSFIISSMQLSISEVLVESANSTPRKNLEIVSVKI